MSLPLWKKELNGLIKIYKRDCKKGKQGCIHSRRWVRSDIDYLKAYINQLKGILR